MKIDNGKTAAGLPLYVRLSKFTLGIFVVLAGFSVKQIAVDIGRPLRTIETVQVWLAIMGLVFACIAIVCSCIVIVSARANAARGVSKFAQRL